ncbi:Sodium-coupled monocarboxylate transporter 2 [Armadillidium vulgare]|nr:Sodium-coupled monocarboxylate transporter 2 [Armadillidium vulgare]
MASLKNAHKTQRVHRERHQPMMRDHLGPMEKKKDYIKRARNQTQKKNIIKKLHKKALNKNPDEFHFHMIRSGMKDGVHFENVEDQEISIGDVKQDLTYVTHKRSLERKRIEKLQAQLHLLGVAPPEPEENSFKNKHILFVDTEKEAKTADPAKLLDTHPSLLNRPFNRLKNSQLSTLSLAAPSQTKLNIKTLSRERQRAYKELSKRIERENKLRIIQEKLEVRKKLQVYKYIYLNY